MSRKMCQWIVRCFYKHNKKDLCDKSVCPKNTNSKCEIIPYKPKYKTIKGWAEKTEYGWVFGEQGKVVLKYPAELRIKTKYLKEKK